jgi:hypothetical protein
MRDICVMNSVKDRTLSRGQLFARVAALAAGAVAAAGLPAPARAETKTG